MRTSLVDSGENTSRLNHVIGSRVAPFDVSGVLLVVNSNGLVVDVKLAILGLDVTFETTMGL